MRNTRKNIRLQPIVKSHIINNKKEYIIVLLIFIIGLFLGVLYINNVKEDQYTNISSYLNSFVEKTKTMESIDSINLLKSSVFQNLILAIILWFLGTTVIRNTCCVRNYTI